MANAIYVDEKDSIENELLLERKRNLKDIIRYTKWNAEMVKRLGIEWFDIVGKWNESHWKGVYEAMKNPRIREATLRAIEAIDRAKIERLKRTGNEDLWFYDD